MKTFVKLIIVVAMILGLTALGTIITTWLWNYYAPMFNLPTFTYWQMFGFTILIRALVSSVSVKKED